MKANTKVIGFDSEKEIDIKKNVKMAKWAKTMLEQLTEKLEEHFENDKGQLEK